MKERGWQIVGPVILVVVAVVYLAVADSLDWWPFGPEEPAAQEAPEPEGAAAHTERFLVAVEGCLETGLKYSNAVTGEVECHPSEEPVEKPEPTLEPTEVLSVTEVVTSTFVPGWDIEWYWSPFRDTTKVLADETTHQTFAEPGVLLDDTAAFDYLSAVETPANVPEGAYAYIAVGQATLDYDGDVLVLPWKERNIYLIILRGLPNDGTDVDLNQQVWVSDYKRGFGIYSPMPAGAYVSLGWFHQQIENGLDNSPNCGAGGCDTATVVVVDLTTESFRSWIVQKDNLDDWQRL